MANTVTVKNNKGGFIQNILGSIAGIPIGIILVLVGIFLIYRNELSAVQNAKDVKELRANVVDVSSTKIDNKNDGKLIATSDKLDYGEDKLTDEVFGVTIETPKLTRVVEMYQWEEREEQDDDTTTYKYNKVWSTELIDSSNFYEKNGHVNPNEMKYQNETFTTTNELKVGDYTLDNKFSNLLDTKEEYSLPEDQTVQEGYIVSGKYITNTKDDKPEIGDLRISFVYASYDVVSVLGKQDGKTIDSYVTKNKKSIYELHENKLSGSEIINIIENRNNTTKWIFRIIGAVIIFIGVNLIIGPVTTLLGYIPLLGKVVNGAIGLVAFVVSLAIFMVTMAVSWIIVRPILGIALLVVAVALVIIIRKLLAKKKETATQNVEVGA